MLIVMIIDGVFQSCFSNVCRWSARQPAKPTVSNKTNQLGVVRCGQAGIGIHSIGTFIRLYTVAWCRTLVSNVFIMPAPCRTLGLWWPSEWVKPYLLYIAILTSVAKVLGAILTATGWSAGFLEHGPRSCWKAIEGNAQAIESCWRGAEWRWKLLWMLLELERSRMVHTARQERLRRPESHEWHTWIMVPTHFQHVVEKKLKNTSHESHT